VTTVLNWSRFEIGLVSPEDAFEAFCAQLFERWVARELGDDLKSYVLRGAGGDGGVEAFATLTNGEVRGLQAKWFPRNLDSSRMNQIQSSVDTALRTFPTLRRYIVAMPHNLTKGTPGKDNKPRKGGVERWAEFIGDLAASHPQLQIVRWDEAGLLDQLAHPGNQEIKAIWFDGEFTHETLKTAWRKTKKRLHDRYLPSLHAVGRVDAIIDADSWTHEQVVDASEALEKALDALAVARSDLEGFERLTLGNLPAGLNSAIPPMADAIGSLRACAASLASVMTAGPTSAVEVFRSTTAIKQFNVELNDYERSRSGAYAAHHAARALSLVRESLDAVRGVGHWISDSAIPRIIQGPAGCGKTHAVARAVERLVERGAPALMILAKTHDPGQGARRMMSEALDAPGWSLSHVLDGLEALAIIDQLRRVKAGTRHDGFSRCLVIIDGLEESPSNSQQWFDVIGDIAVELESRRRVHLLASARPEYVRQRARPPGVTLVTLDVDGDVDLPALFQTYANHYAIHVDRVPWLGWAMRNPLEVRLFAEEFRGRSVSASEGANANLLTLFRRKLERLEVEARDRAGSQAWSDYLNLVFSVLTELTELGSKASSDWIPSVDIVHAVAERDPEFTAQRVRDVLSLLIEYGLIDRMFPPTEGLAASPPVYTLATRHVSDFVLASALAPATLAEIARGDALVFPEILLDRHSAAILYAAQLAQCGYFVVDLSWSNAPPDLRMLHAASLRLLPPDTAGQRAAEIERWLIETTELNRHLLAELVVQIARIPEHPLGPRLLDRALRSLPLAERDPIWSVPEDLRGTGPWARCFVPILDNVRLSADIDNWESLPLLVAWTCSSVVEERRRRAREMLARWGGSRLADMVELLAYMADVDDPQLLDDLVVAALGAAVIAPVDNPAIGELARLVDRLFFAEHAAVPTTSVPIRMAARAIIERAALVFPGRFDVELARAKPPYKAHGSWPALDLNELREDGAIETLGRPLPALDHVVRGDLDRYVADRCFREFSNPAGRRRVDDEAQVDPSLLLALESGALDGPKPLVEAQRERRVREQAEPERGLPAGLLESLQRSIAAVTATREDERDEDQNEKPVELTEEERFKHLKQLHDLLRHRVDKPNLSNEFLALLDHAAEVSATKEPPAKLVRNAMIASLVRSWGWSPQGFRRYNWDDPPTVVDDAIAQRHGAGASHGQRSEVATFNEKYVWAAVDRVAGALADRLPVWSAEAGEWRLLTTLEKIGNDFPDPMPRSAEEDDRELAWVGAWESDGILTEQFADEPDLVLRAERWLTEGALPDARTMVRVDAEGWNDAQILGLSHFRYGHQYCVDQLVQINAFAIDPADLAYVRRDARHVLQNLHAGSAWLDGGVYGSPAIACWAPWLTWHNQESGYNSFTDEGAVHRVRIHDLVGTFTARYEGQSPGEPSAWLPSPGLRTSLGVVGMQGGRWHRRYLDRGSCAVAVERDCPSVGHNFDHHYLVTSREGLMNYLAPEGLRPVWVVRVFREVTPALFMNDKIEIDPQPHQVHRSRDTTWLLLDLDDDGELELIPVGDEFERFG
jgi:hypothetical protein